MGDAQKQRMQKIADVKGIDDLLPADAPLWEHFDNAVRNMLHAYGYQQARMPAVKQTQLFVCDIGEVADIIEKEMYTFTDALDGKQLTMYPEGTAVIVHAVIEYNLLYDDPKRLWYTGPMFRYEHPRRGRYRQFRQVGIEALGFTGPDIDAEVILIYQRLQDDLGLAGLELELNSLSQTEERAAHRADLIKYLEGFQDVLNEDGKHCLYSNPLRMLDAKDPALRDMAASAFKLINYLDDESRVHFEGVQKLLKASSVPFTINPRLVRGPDCYDLTVFEWTTNELGAQGTVADGGRYGPLIEQIGGKSAPACDQTVGAEHIIKLLHEEKLEPEAQGYGIYIAHQRDEAQVQVLIATECPHDANLDVILHALPEGRNSSFESQFKRADANGASYTTIIGDDEVTQGVAQVRPLQGDPTAGARQTMPSDQLADHLIDALVANND